jgi:hypothetical protein
MTQALYDNDGYMIVPGITAGPLPLSVASCNGQTLTCTDRNYWLNAWRVVDARPGVCWPMSGPKGRKQ